MKMEQTSFQLLPANIGATSSIEAIRAEFRRVGLISMSSDRVKDVHFKDYVLPTTLKTVGDVKTLLARLDAYAKQCHGGACDKAKAARVYIAYAHNPNIPLLTWTFRALAESRRTPCACHELGTYHPQ